jgi:RND family efflux transporter MFP subunit
MLAHHPPLPARPILSRFALRMGAGLLCAGTALAAQALPPLQTVQVSALSSPDRLILDGTIQAIREATLAAQVAGTVTAVEIQAGDAVHAGQVLLRLDGQEAGQAQRAAQALIREADAELALAQAELRRRETLYAQRYISQAAYQQARARAETARAQAAARHAQAAAAQTHHDHFTLKAPHDGLIGRLDAHPGDMVMPGQPLATLFDPGALRIQAAVPQRHIGQLAPRAHVEWPPGFPDLPATLPVQILPARDAASLTGTLRLALPPGVRGPAPGTPVRIGIDLDGTTRIRLWVPAGAVVRRGDLSGVYVPDANGMPRLRQVRPGPRDGDRVEILSGLAEGESIVPEPGRMPLEDRKP